MADRPQATLLLWRDTAPDGPAACVWLERLDEGVCYLGMLSVDPALQDRGLGRRVLEAAEAWARAAGARRMQLTVVDARQPLIAWYERRGYRRTGDTRPFPYDDPAVGRPLRSDLALVVLEKPL